MLALTGVLTLTGGCEESTTDRDAGPAVATTLGAAGAADVTLTGEVAAAFGDHVIQLGSAPAEPVLVVLPTPNTFPVGTHVEVRGRIRTFEAARLGSELGVDLGAEAGRFEGQRCLVAVTVRML